MNAYDCYCISVQAFLFLACLLPQPSLSHASLISRPLICPSLHLCPRPYDSFVRPRCSWDKGAWALPHLTLISFQPYLCSGLPHTPTTVNCGMIFFCTRASVSCLSVFHLFIPQMLEHLFCARPVLEAEDTALHQTKPFPSRTLEWEGGSR